jgi:hypothetical protein
MFLNNVTDLINGGRNITHVLGFNEPDGPWSQGGSNMTVSSAAQSWLREVAPSHQRGIKAGAPVVTQGRVFLVGRLHDGLSKLYD